MPEIKMKHIVSSSSEDVNHKAENLLKPETYYKWKCKSGEDKKASVIIQLEESSQIASIDIGNNGAAFIELLVGKSTCPEEEYQVLLVASTFMSPSESKAGTNTNRVRFFGPDDLNKTVMEQKWDRIKLVCSQPYNRESAYGLSFVTMHSPAEKNKVEESSTHSKVNVQKIGNFVLKDDPDPKPSIGSFFSRRKLPDSSPSPSLSLAAAARDATSVVKRNLSVPVSIPSSPPPTILHKGKSEPPSREKRKSESSEVQRTKPETSKDSKASTSGKQGTPSPKAQTDGPPTKKFKSEEASSEKKKQKPARKQVPYHRMLRGVVFALSGYQNPERGKIRDRGMTMGAEYRPDWGPGCTHLICAFRNTPKFNQVKGKGKIVTRKWIDDCDKSKRRLSIKGYRIDGGESSSSYSESEDEDEAVKTKEKDISKQDGPSKTAQNVDGEFNDTDHKETKDKQSSSECDTMDELEKARKEDDPYDGTTEEDDNVVPESNSVLTKMTPNFPELPNFFEDKQFLLYGSFEEEERRLLTRYITAYNGKIDDYMGESTDYVVTNEDWDDNFEQASKENTSLCFIRPLWIFKCHESRQLIDYRKFMVNPG